MIKIEDLNLNDLKMFDSFFKEDKEVDEIYNKFSSSVRDFFSEKNPDYMNLRTEESSNIRGLYALGIEGSTHALVLNLFLRSNNEELKEKIKQMINENGITSIENYIKVAILSKRSLGKRFLEKLIVTYLESRDNDMIIKYTDETYIDILNDYYKDELGRIDQEYIATNYGI